MKLRAVMLAAVGFALLAHAERAEARPRSDFGLGIIIGRPTGATFEFGLSSSQSIDLAIGLDAFEGDRFYVHGDYLFYVGPVIQGQADLSPYLGPGVFVSGADPVRGGLRVPFGLSLDFQAEPLKIFGEVAPHVRFAEKVDLDFSAAIGFRYFF